MLFRRGPTYPFPWGCLVGSTICFEKAVLSSFNVLGILVENQLNIHVRV